MGNGRSASEIIVSDFALATPPLILLHADDDAEIYPPPPQTRFPWKAVGVAFGAGALTAGVWTFAAMHRVRKNAVATISENRTASPDAIPAFPITGDFPDLHDSPDIARLNLLCCPGAENEVERHLATLDQWAERVRSETARNFHRYRANPAEFGSEAAWRMAMMRTVIGLDLGVKYDEKLGANARELSNREFFADPHKVFITGILGPGCRTKKLDGPIGPLFF